MLLFHATTLEMIFEMCLFRTLLHTFHRNANGIHNIYCVKHNDEMCISFSYSKTKYIKSSLNAQGVRFDILLHDDACCLLFSYQLLISPFSHELFPCQSFNI